MDNYGEIKPNCQGSTIYQIMTNTITPNNELRPEYDETSLKNGVRGKYAQQYAAGTNIVRLAPDVAAAFPTEEAVNQALRSVLKERSEER